MSISPRFRTGSPPYLSHMEPLLTPEPTRLTIFPLKYPELWRMYKNATALFWMCEEVDLSKDMNDWEGLTADERYFIKHILAFFGSSDTIVNMNIAERFINEVQPLEAKFYYNFQESIENIHSEMYSLLIDTYIRDGKEKMELFNAVQTIPAIAKKAEWCFRWIQDMTAPFAQRLLAFAIVEGVYFSGSFCSIFWLKERGKMPGLCFSNELISRDEGLHVEFAVMLYTQMIRERLPQGVVHAMFKEAVAIEKEFIPDSIPCAMLGMNAGLMSTYIEYVADRLLAQLGYDRVFQSHNPFPFMERISLETKANFFETRVSAYSKANVGLEKDHQSIHEFSLEADF